jgi:hypothetical protein
LEELKTYKSTLPQQNLPVNGKPEDIRGILQERAGFGKGEKSCK